jgi:hypothetical protein
MATRQTAPAMAAGIVLPQISLTMEVGTSLPHMLPTMAAAMVAGMAGMAAMAAMAAAIIPPALPPTMAAAIIPPIGVGMGIPLVMGPHIEMALAIGMGLALAMGMPLDMGMPPGVAILLETPQPLYTAGTGGTGIKRGESQKPQAGAG